MTLSSKINHIVTKLTRAIDFLDVSNDNEEMSYKLTRISVRIKTILTDPSLTLSAENRNIFLSSQKQLRQLKKTLIGDLSAESELSALSILRKIRALMKGLLVVVSEHDFRDESGALDSAYCEIFEPWIDPETGQVVLEEDTEVVNACGTILLSPNSDQDSFTAVNDILESCTTHLSQLVLSHEQSLHTTIDEVDVFLSSERAERKRDKRIQKTSARYFTPSPEEAEKLKPKVEKSAACRTLTAVGDKKNNLEGLNSREVILTMWGAIQKLKTERRVVSTKSAEEYLCFSPDQAVRVSHMSSADNLSNVFVNSLGRYGRLKKNGKEDAMAVLSLFETIEQRCGKDKLMQIMFEFSKKPAAITLKFCGLRENEKDRTLLRGLTRALTLVFQAEIWRYLPLDLVGTQERSEPVRHISFAMGLAEGIELLEEDRVKLSDLFDADAELGLPSGQNILHSFNQIKAKQSKLQNLVRQNLAENDGTLAQAIKAYPNAQLVPSKSLYTEKLRRTFGYR